MPTEIEVGLNMAIIVPSQYLGNVRIVDIEKTHTLIVWYRAGFERILPPKGHCCDETCLLRSRSSVLPEGRGSPSASPNRIANTGPHAKRLDHEWPHHGLHIASRQAGEIQSPLRRARQDAVHRHGLVVRRIAGNTLPGDRREVSRLGGARVQLQGHSNPRGGHWRGRDLAGRNGPALVREKIPPREQRSLLHSALLARRLTLLRNPLSPFLVTTLVSGLDPRS